MSFRRVISFTTLVSFVLLLATSVVLYVVPHGRVAYWSDWHFLGLSKEQWGAQHVTVGVLFVVAGLVHGVLNWRAIRTYMKDKASGGMRVPRELAIAVALALVFCVSTLYHLAPVQWIMSLNGHLKEQSTEKFGDPPYGHAELSSWRLLAKRTGLDPAKVGPLLEQSGYAPSGPDETVLALAQRYGVAPKEIFEIMQQARSEPEPASGLPATPPSGLGRLTLQEICSTYDVPLPKALEALSAQGISARGDQSLKEIATAAGRHPQDLYEALRSVE
jgi:hypothetical protein